MEEKPLISLAEAYFGDLGETNANIARKQVHWLCERASGENILDIGSTQGLTSILMAREGKKVIGLDQSETSLDYALQLLDREDDSTKELIELSKGHFMVHDFKDQIFDTIIFKDVLQNVIDTERHMEKAVELIQENGTIVMTVPFGIDPSINQIKPFYLIEIYKLQVNFLQISEINFYENWIGVVFKKVQSATPKTINEDAVIKLEKAFADLQMQQFSNRNSNESFEESLEEEKKVAIESIKKNIYLMEQLQDTLTREETLLRLYKQLQKKYHSLSNSKLGKITNYYWKKRRSLFGGK